MIRRFKQYKQLAGNLFFLSINKFVDLGIPIIILPFLISKVGMYNYGIYAFAGSIFTYLLNITSYGFALSAVREISLHRDDSKRVNIIFNRVFSTKLLLVVLSVIFLLLLITIFPEIAKYKIIYYCFTLMIVADLFNTSWYFYGIEKMGFITMINTISKSTFVILALFFIKKESDFQYIAFYQLIGYLLASIGCIILITTKFKIRLRIAPYIEIKNELIKGFSSFLSLVSPTLYSTFAIFIVGLFGSPIHVTIITTSVRLSAIFSGLNTIMTNVFYPYIVRNRNKELLVKRIFIYSGILLSIILFILTEFILKIWVGDSIIGTNFRDLVFITQILCLSPLLMSFVSAYGINGLLVNQKDHLFG